MFSKSLFFCLTLFLLPSLSLSSDALEEAGLPLETIPSLESLIDLDKEWGLDLGVVCKRQSLLRSRDEITNGDVSVDIMNLLALKDHYEQRKEAESSVESLEDLVDKMRVKIDGYKKTIKKKSKSIVDLQSSMKVLQKIRVEKLNLLEVKKGRLMRF